MNVFSRKWIMCGVNDNYYWHKFISANERPKVYYRYKWTIIPRLSSPSVLNLSRLFTPRDNDVVRGNRKQTIFVS